MAASTWVSLSVVGRRRAPEKERYVTPSTHSEIPTGLRLRHAKHLIQTVEQLPGA